MTRSHSATLNFGANHPGRRVLVTGATGLLGRQVVRAFERKSWAVKGTGHSRADGAQVLRVDLADASQVEKALDVVG